METQEKILRAVEYGTFERVGSSESQQVDVRIVGATNADLPAMARQGRFKADLLDRLAFEVVRVPPLRERGDDILLLARHFAVQMARELERDELPVFSAGVEVELQRHSWPGNVRELKNVIERAVYRSDTASIEQLTFDPFPSEQAEPVAVPGVAAAAGQPQGPPDPSAATSAPRAAESRTLPEAIAALEVAMLGRALAESRYHQKQAAERLGITYHQFRGLYRKHAEALASPRD